MLRAKSEGMERTSNLSFTLPRFRILALAFLFFLVAALTRFALYLVESRIQVAAFWVLAAVAGALLPNRGRAWSLFTVLACGIAATAGVLLIKWLLEDDGYWGVRVSLSACHVSSCRVHR